MKVTIDIDKGLIQEIKRLEARHREYDELGLMELDALDTLAMEVLLALDEHEVRP